MIQTIEAVIGVDGKVRLLSPLRLPYARRALVTILEEKPNKVLLDSTLLSESALAEDWNKAEEDEAWSHLQQEQ
ncbi:MAG: hypothetical protein HQM10_21400 [Candidatus Riflebacteria bacterium]|nr:hypothetical protein [Candidatus Riflebacteria bacterium]